MATRPETAVQLQIQAAAREAANNAPPVTREQLASLQRLLDTVDERLRNTL